MALSDILNKTNKFVKSNSPEILTALNISGLITTTYFTAKASFKAAEMIREKEAVDGTHSDPKERFKERAKLVWKVYIPAGISGVVAVGCAIGASKASGRRTTAAVTAYSLTERAFSEYREKVVEQVGKGKEQQIRDSIAQDRVAADKPGSREVVVVGSGNVLCCELYTGRYFRSDMETLRSSLNDMNAMIIADVYQTLSDWYNLIGLQHTSDSDRLGWDSDKLLELHFSTVLADNGEPCLAFEYNYVKPLK